MKSDTAYNPQRPNEELESLPYFVNSRETEIHEVDIIPADFVEKVAKANINELKKNYN